MFFFILTLQKRRRKTQTGEVICPHQSQPCKIRTNGLSCRTSKKAKVSGHLKLASDSLTILPAPQQFKKKKKGHPRSPHQWYEMPPHTRAWPQSPFHQSSRRDQSRIQKGKVKATLTLPTEPPRILCLPLLPPPSHIPPSNLQRGGKIVIVIKPVLTNGGVGGRRRGGREEAKIERIRPRCLHQTLGEGARTPAGGPGCANKATM